MLVELFFFLMFDRLLDLIYKFCITIVYSSFEIFSHSLITFSNKVENKSYNTTQCKIGMDLATTTGSKCDLTNY